MTKSKAHGDASMSSTGEYQFYQHLYDYNWDHCVNLLGKAHLAISHAYIFRTWVYVYAFRRVLRDETNPLISEMINELMITQKLGSLNFLIKYWGLSDHSDGNTIANVFYEKIQISLQEYDKIVTDSENWDVGLNNAGASFMKRLSDSYKESVGSEIPSDIGDTLFSSCMDVGEPAAIIALEKLKDSILGKEPKTQDAFSESEKIAIKKIIEGLEGEQPETRDTVSESAKPNLAYKENSISKPSPVLGQKNGDRHLLAPFVLVGLLGVVLIYSASGLAVGLGFILFIGALITGVNAIGKPALAKNDNSIVKPSEQGASTIKLETNSELNRSNSTVNDSAIDRFFQHVPQQMYHAFDGRVEAFDERDLLFKCGCGDMHSTSNAFAILDSGLTNEVVYVCPRDENIFILVKGKGGFSLSRLDTVSVVKATSDDDLQAIQTGLELRKKLDN